tara:strand:- start:25237 stop:26121 length:885 start_codon:yes stop_codon:yes gene_type:complete
MSFSSQIQHYTGSVTGFDDQVTTWLNDGVKSIIARAGAVSPDLLYRFSHTSTLSNSSGFEIGSGRVLYVERDAIDTGTDLHEAKLIPLNQKNQVADTSSIYFAPTTAPVYYVDSNKLYVLPVPTSVQPASIVLVNYGTVNNSAETITSFPVEFYKHVVLWVGMNILHAKLIKLTETTLASLETEITTEATSALTRARKLMEDDANLTNVNASVDDFISNEDTEMVSASLSAITTELNRAQKHMDKWTIREKKLITEYNWTSGQLGYVKGMYEECWAPYQGVTVANDSAYAGDRK